MGPIFYIVLLTVSFKVANSREFERNGSRKGGEDDSINFALSENQPFVRKVKLQSLTDNVEVQLTSENTENSVKVFISFCPDNKGVLYTTSYASKLDFSLKKPQLEQFYDAYSCNSSIPFYSDSTQPVFPLIIRLESKNPVNGSLSVLVNGKLEPQSDSESHVAEYETGTFTIENEQESMIFELNYPPAKGNIHVFFDVVAGAISVHLSACKSHPQDAFLGEFPVGAHRIDINLETLMSSTNCSLLEIHPSTVYLSVDSAHFSQATFQFWKPAQGATWNIALIVGAIFAFLIVTMILIIYFGRRKTGKLVINYFQK